MAEWLIENGIGENRAIKIDNGDLIGARIEWPGMLAAGQVEDARLVSRAAGSARGKAEFASGEEALVDRLPRDASEGALLRLEVTRAMFSEKGRVKLAQARPTTKSVAPAPTLAQTLSAAGETARVVHQFPKNAWEDVWSDAWSGLIDFAGGSLHFSTTPAMTLVDVDGTLPARELALAAVIPLAGAIRRFDLGGSVGIDFPSLPEKADRRAVDVVLADALADWPHERTAMNGFGFVQIVSRLERPSLLHRVGQGRVGAAARLLLRRAEAISDPGALLITCHPAIKARFKAEWLDELGRRTGRDVRIETDPTLALEAGFAQAIAP